MNNIKSKIFRVVLLVLALLIISALALPALAQNVPCYFSLGGAKFTAAVYRSVICEWEMQSTTVLDIQSGVTETHANNPTFSGNPLFTGSPSFTGSTTINGGTITGTIAGDPTFTGTVAFSGTVDIDGALTSATGALTITDDVDISGNLTSVTGAITITDSLNVTGTVDFDSTLNVDGATTLTTTTLTKHLTMTAQTVFSVVMGIPITPTGLYQPLESAVYVTAGGTADIAAGSGNGGLLTFLNINASQAITIDGTGGNVECKADVVLDAGDTLMLLWDGTNWRCLSGYDNS